MHGIELLMKYMALITAIFGWLLVAAVLAALVCAYLMLKGRMSTDAAIKTVDIMKKAAKVASGKPEACAEVYEAAKAEATQLQMESKTYASINKRRAELATQQ